MGTVRREPVLWSTDPMRRDVHFGPVPQALATRTITWYDQERGNVATSVVVYNDRGDEVSEFRTVFMGPIDPIVIHRLHRLIAALKSVDGRQLALASAAVTNKTPYVIQDAEFTPANAEAELRTQLCDGYDAAVQHLSDDVAGDIKRLRDVGLEVSTVMVTQECVSGRLLFSEQFAALQVESPESFTARKAARAALLAPLQQHIDRLLGNKTEPSSRTRETMEQAIVHLAQHGVTDGDLLLGFAAKHCMDLSYALTLQSLQGKMSDTFGGLMLSFIGGMMPEPDSTHAAAKQVHALGINPARDEQWLRYGIAGICADIKNGRLTVTRNDL